MIICHSQKLIFLKTKTGVEDDIETALSQFCGPDCVISSVQNDHAQHWPDGTRSETRFTDHMTAREVRQHVPEPVWSTYRKIAVARNPFDSAVSRFKSTSGISFGDYTDLTRAALTENCDIAPLTGPDAIDILLRFEDLEQDIGALGIKGLVQAFRSVRPDTTCQRDDPSTLYDDNPRAIDIVAEECADVIKHFNYTTPRIKSTQQTDGRQYFTLTAGRTATAWLANLIGDNLGIPAIHEALRPDDFGTKTPDIRAMRMFNNYGMTRYVRRFWDRKLQMISGDFAETNHTLAKCGLLEALSGSDLRHSATIILLRRNLVNQCVSYLMRGDFNNATIEWQWYLAPNYRNVMVNPSAFTHLGPTGRALWYCYEMEARFAYYKELYSDRLNIVETSVETLTTQEGARSFLASIGHENPVTLPQKTNATDVDEATKAMLKNELCELMKGFDFNPEDIARSYIRNGRQLAQPYSQPCISDRPELVACHHAAQGIGISPMLAR